MTELDPDDLVNGDGAIDLRRLNDGREEIIGAETCAECRDDHRGAIPIAELARWHDVSIETVRVHVRGECSHSHDVAPVEGDD